MGSIKSGKTHLEDYLLGLQARGKYAFTLPQLSALYPASEKALYQAIFRLQKQNKLVSVRRGFYVLVPPEYASIKILPPVRFIDELMKHLNKPYYVSLLSAAAMHGVSHQAPQVFQVMTKQPALRPVQKKGIKVQFYVKSEIPKHGIEQKKTEVGYINVSSPELTALDIMEYNKQIGGLSRALTILTELIETMSPEKLSPLCNDFSITTIQRLGYFLDKRLKARELADVIENKLSGKVIKSIPLGVGMKTEGFPVDKKWGIIENATVQSDFEE